MLKTIELVIVMIVVFGSILVHLFAMWAEGHEGVERKLAGHKRVAKTVSVIAAVGLVLGHLAGHGSH